jgi:integrase
MDKVKGTGYADGRHGKGRLFLRGRVWWVQYYANGQQFRESSDSYKKAVAEKLLMKRLVAADDGRIPAKQCPITYEEMRQRLVTRRLIEKPRLAKSRSEAGLKHLDTFFAELKSSVITEQRIQEFIVSRQATGASSATINRALAALRQMFRMSAKQIKDAPDFNQLMLDEPRARKGFLSREEYLRVLAVLPDYVRPIFTFGYCTGMRLGELQKLTWGHVDLKEGMIRLEPEDTKNDESREIPYGKIPELAGIVDHLWRQATDKSGLVFTRAGGRSLGSFRKAWIRACIKSLLGRMVWECSVCHSKVEVAKQEWPPEVPKTAPPRCACGVTCHWTYEGLIFHDLRRTAIRNLRRAGVAESVAMKISGHKTREVFERYNIKDRRDVIEATDKLAEFYRAEDQKLESPTARPN